MTAATPVLYPVAAEVDQGRSYLDGYPQSQELEPYAQDLIRYLQHSHALSSINLALWNRHYDNEEHACNAVDAFLKQRDPEAQKLRSEIGKGCEETYRCDYDKHRFPSTLIAVECGSNGHRTCQTTQDNWPVRGACLGDQYYLYTVKFLPDTPISVHQEEQVSNINAESGDGESNQNNEEHIQGRWTFQTSLTNRGCLCIS